MTVLPSPVGRDAEIAQIDRFLHDLRAGSRTLLLEGEIGIGKTTLIQHGTELVRSRGYALLAARPVEAEVPFEFAALADLLDDVPPELIDALPEPQRRAIGVSVLRDASPESPVDPRTIATAVVTVIRSLAATRPVVLVVDDLPWLDPPSARVLSFLLRRSGLAPIGLIAAARTDWSETPARLALDDLDQRQLERIRLGPISVGALRVLLAARSPASTPVRSQLLRLHDASGGNPLFALELAAQADFIQLVDHTAPLPQSLRRLVLGRIDVLSPGERDVLLTCALSGEPTSSIVCGAAANPNAAEDDLDAAIQAGILVATAQRLRFAHPLVRSVVVSEARAADRRAAHRRLSAIVDRPEERARHLGLGTKGRNNDAAAALEDAARLAGDRGACETGAELARLAVALTPSTERDALHRRVALEAEYRFEASDPAGACALLASIIDDVPRGTLRADLLRRLARYLAYRGEPLTTWEAMLTAALAESGDDEALSAAILLDLAVIASNSGDQETAMGRGAAALLLAESSGDKALESQLCAGAVYVAFILGQGLQGDLVERALSGPPSPTRLSMELRPNVAVGHVLHLSDDLDGARILYEEEYQRARQEGIETGLPLMLWGLVETEAFAGNWDRAEHLCSEGYELAQDSGSLMMIGLMSGVRALINTYRGRIKSVDADAGKAVEVAHTLGIPWLVPVMVQAVGLARLSVGDARGAHDRLHVFSEAVRAAGITEPGMLRFTPDDVEALIRLGELDSAAAVLEPFEKRSIELGRGWGIAVAGRCRAFLLAAGGELAAAEECVDRAIVVHQRLPLPFEYARTLLIAGEIHRRARHKSLASARLNEALQIFVRLGAPLWVERTTAELDRLGLRRADASSSLTLGEERVAELVAAGLSNPQVAAQLFMAQRTVEAHLSRIYRKLGVTSRTEMARAILFARATVPYQDADDLA